MPKECPACGLLKPPSVCVCPGCSFKPERQSEIRVSEGELVERRPEKSNPTREEKQDFWSMALFVDRERGKNGRLAKALYKAKFGEWPRNLLPKAKKPTPDFRSYECSRRIAWSKSRRHAA
jgi:hypothetical protein